MNIGDFSGQRGNAGTTYDTADDQARASLIMATQSTDTEGDDSRETDALEEQDDKHHRQAGIIPRPHRGAEEDDHAGQVRKEHPSRPHVVHEQRAGEAAHGECPLCAGQELGSQCTARAWPRLDDIVDEVTRDRDLRTAVRELCERGVEHPVLLAEGKVGSFHVSLLDLELHVCVRDLGYV